MGEKDHWAYNLAETVTSNFPGTSKYVCATGLSPSGRVHIGNFRDIITSDFVCRALQNSGLEAELVLSWDDFDRFRKVPKGVPNSFEKYIGMPLSAVPDPLGELSSYAERFGTELEDVLPQLGITARIVSQTDAYKRGDFDDSILVALHHRREIANILSKFKTQGLSEEEVEGYFPLQIYSRFTGKDNTTVLAFDGESNVTYSCQDTGKRDVVDITKERIVKLPWRVDWPMRWAKQQVHFEPGGKDHAGPQGSYSSGKQIVEAIFNSVAPVFQGYEFVGIRGIEGKMSSSTGELITPKELLKLYEPEMIRLMFARISPTSAFDFSFDAEVIRQYSELDRLLSHLQDASEVEKQTVELSLLKAVKKDNPISFRQAVGFGQIVDFNSTRLGEIMVESGIDCSSESVVSRSQRANVWLNEYNPGQATVLLSEKNEDYYEGLSQLEMNKLAKLKVLVDDEQIPLQDLETKIYSLGKSDGELKGFFQNTYQLLFGKKGGPRLSTLINFGDRKQISNLLDFVNS
jgi:lysyl-tRNA synthetase, class I